jgi:hypothetical protein
VVKLVYNGGFGTDRFLVVGDTFTEYFIDISLHYLVANWLCLLILNFI